MKKESGLTVQTVKYLQEPAQAQLSKQMAKLIVPMYGKYVLNYSNFSKTPKGAITLWTSEDSGSSWSYKEVLPGKFEDIWLQEPAILKVDDTRYIMQVRTATGSSPSNRGLMMQTVSDDGGKTWSDYRDMGFVGHAPELVKPQQRCSDFSIQMA